MGNGMNKILPGLYVGNFRDSKDQQQLTEHNITHILAIHDNARKLPCNSNKEYLCIIASDSPGQNLTQFFSVCNDFIHSTRLHGGNVLIHCLAGMSRSVTVTVAYMMCVTSLNWRDCLKAVQGSRSVANPNVGFLKQLQEFEKERLHDEKHRLRDKFPDTSLSREDEAASKDLLALYYHFMSVGEMCDGNCPPGTSCPRGICRPNRSSNIMRCYQRELLSLSSAESKTTTQRENAAEDFAFLYNRNASPRRKENATADCLPNKYSSMDRRLAKSADHTEEASFDNQSQIEACNSVRSFPYETTVNLGKSFAYYTSSSARSSPIHHVRNIANFQGTSSYSPHYSSHKGKVLYCPSAPSSPTKSLNRASSVASDSPAYSSPSKSKSKRLLKNGETSGSSTSLNSLHLQIGQNDNNSSECKKKSKKSPVSKENLRKLISTKNLKAQEDLKSMSTTTPSPNPKGRTDHHVKLNFKQTVKRLFPQITAIQSIGKLSKNLLKQTENSYNSSLPNLTCEKDNANKHFEKVAETITDSSDSPQCQAYNVYFDRCENYRRFSDCYPLVKPVEYSSQYVENPQPAVPSGVCSESSDLNKDYVQDISVKSSKKNTNYRTSVCKDGYSTTLQNDILYVETSCQDFADQSQAFYSDKFDGYLKDEEESAFLIAETYQSRPSSTSIPPPIPPRRLSYSIASGVVSNVPPVPPREKKINSYYQD